MTGSRKVLLVIVALAVPAYFLPLTRDELDWWWAQSHGHSDNYLRYLSDWPDGRHVAEAKLFCEQRRWMEATRAEILQAATLATVASPASAESEAAYRRDQVTRRDSFLWKKTTIDHTIASYQNYLRQFPAGRHSDEARREIQALGQPASETNAPPQ